MTQSLSLETTSKESAMQELEGTRAKVRELEGAMAKIEITSRSDVLQKIMDGNLTPEKAK